MKLPSFLAPLGAYESILENPFTKDALEVAVFHEHRIAFYYWALWTTGVKYGDLRISPPPTLVSFDWHEDTAAPDEIEQQELQSLNLEKSSDVAFFSWAMLNPLNDGHILSAAYLNLIADIFLVRKQENSGDPPFVDMFGNIHQVHSFDNVKDMFNSLKQHTGVDKIYLDIDLDYFTESPDSCGGGPELTLVPKNEIITPLDPKSDLMKFILPRLAGMTIAIEPEFCGGYSSAMNIYQTVEKTMFNGQLLSQNNEPSFKIDEEQIILKPRSFGDELKDLIISDLARDGKPVSEQTVKEYQTQINRALDSLVAEAENEYGKKEYVSLADLKQKNENV